MLRCEGLAIEPFVIVGVSRLKGCCCFRVKVVVFQTRQERAANEFRRFKGWLRGGQ